MTIKLKALKDDFTTINGFEIVKIEKDKIYNLAELGTAAASRLLQKNSIIKIEG